MKLFINKEISEIISPLTNEEFKSLESNIKQNGCLDTIKIFCDGSADSKDSLFPSTILDGHNRYIICTDNNIKFETEVIEDILTTSDAKLWVIDNQLARRNITSFYRAELELKKKPILAKIAKENQIKAGGAVPSNLAEAVKKDTRKSIAKAASVSTGQVSKIEHVLAKSDKSTIEKLRSGDIKVDKVYKELKNKEKDVIRKQQLITATKSYKESEDIKIYFGDCLTVTKKEVKANSVDLILTDPPYPYEFIECWSKLSELAEYALKPSGLVIAMSGQLYLPEVISRMQKHLEYYWTVGLKLIGQHQIVHPVNVQCGWKPIFIFQKEPKKKLGYCPLDYFESAPIKEKADHEWQQDLSIFETLVNKFSEPGGLVLDPFAGSGTTLLACKNLKRKVIGVEIDKDIETVIKGRLS